MGNASFGDPTAALRAEYYAKHGGGGPPTGTHLNNGVRLLTGRDQRLLTGRNQRLLTGQDQRLLFGLDNITQNTPNKMYVPDFTGGFNTHPNLHREMGTSGVHPSLLNPVAAAAEARRHQRNFEKGLHSGLGITVPGRPIMPGEDQAAALDRYRSSTAHRTPSRSLTEKPGGLVPGAYGYEHSLVKRMDLQNMVSNLYSEVKGANYDYTAAPRPGSAKHLTLEGQGRDSAMQAVLNLMDAGTKPVAPGSILEAATDVVNSGKGKGGTNIISSPKEKKEKPSYSDLHPYGAVSFAEGHYSPWDAGQAGATSGGPRGRFRRFVEESSIPYSKGGSIKRAFTGALGDASGAGRGGFGSQALTQLRHAAIWQMYTPVIGAVGYGAYRALTGDPATDRAAYSLIGIGATEGQRAGATQWAYNKSNTTPFSTPTQFLKGFKETASGLGIPLTDKTAPMLQKAAETARLFGMFSMEDSNVAARRLSRATLMEANARGITDAAGKMGIFDRLANNLAGLYSESSTRGQETDVAMHYMGSTALGKLKWGYDEGAAVNSYFVEQGIAASSSGVFFRNMGSNPTVMADAVKARMFWEKAYENQAARGGTELQRQDLPLSYLGRNQWMPNATMDKKDPEKAARIKEMFYRASQNQKILSSGNKESQFKLWGQSAQDWLRLEEAGLKGLSPPQALEPMVQMIGQHSPQEFADIMTGNVNKIKQTPHQMEQAATEALKIPTPGTATGVLSNQFAEWFANTWVGKGTVALAKHQVGVDLVSQFRTIVGKKGVTSGEILKFAEVIQRQRNAGVIDDLAVGTMQETLYAGFNNNPMFGQGRSVEDKAQIKEAYDRLGGKDKLEEAHMRASHMIPVHLQNEGTQRITEDRMKKEGKSLGDIIESGMLNVHIDPRQVNELRQALGGADPYSVTELPGGELKVQVRPPTKKPVNPTTPPHNGADTTSGMIYTWGSDANYTDERGQIYRRGHRLDSTISAPSPPVIREP
jgi:hypothetical protein